MPTNRTTIKVDGRGRILLPKPLRQKLGIVPQAAVEAELKPDGSVVLRDVRAERRRLVREAEGSFSGRGGSTQDLIARRREAATRESGDG